MLDAELMGPIAALGIVKGKPFQPDDRMKQIMQEALSLANASARSLFMKPRHSDWFYYPDSAWYNYRGNWIQTDPDKGWFTIL